MNTHSVITPQQKRSEASLEKMLGAAGQLAAQGSFDDASINEIVDEAGLSVGAFYARFKDKSALFDVMQQRTLDELQQSLITRIEKFEARQKKSGGAATLDAIAQFAIDTLYELYSRSPGLIRAIYMHTRIKRDAVMFERVKRFNVATIERSRALVDLVSKKPPSKETYDSWTGAISVVGSFLREQMLFGDPMPLTTKMETSKARKIAKQMLIAFMSGHVGRAR